MQKLLQKSTLEGLEGVKAAFTQKSEVQAPLTLSNVVFLLALRVKSFIFLQLELGIKAKKSNNEHKGNLSRHF